MSSVTRSAVTNAPGMIRAIQETAPKLVTAQPAPWVTSQRPGALASIQPPNHCDHGVQNAQATNDHTTMAAVTGKNSTARTRGWNRSRSARMRAVNLSTLSATLTSRDAPFEAAHLAPTHEASKVFYNLS